MQGAWVGRVPLRPQSGTRKRAAANWRALWEAYTQEKPSFIITLVSQLATLRAHSPPRSLTSLLPSQQEKQGHITEVVYAKVFSVEC